MPKNVYGNTYVHRDFLHTLPEECMTVVNQALSIVNDRYEWNIVKVAADKNSVTFSVYPDFYKNPHPQLLTWIKVDIEIKKIKQGNSSQKNPLILHRKETFIDESHPLFDKFANLTKQEVEAGLYEPKIRSRIGRRNFWESLLRQRNLQIVDHNLINVEHPDHTYHQNGKDYSQLSLFHHTISFTDNELLQMAGKTAMTRVRPSSVAQILVKDKILNKNHKIFDWGCGKGRDIGYFKDSGFTCEGWDPVHRPKFPPNSYPKHAFNWVNCAFILNVIPGEHRRKALLEAVYNFLPASGHISIAVRDREEIERNRKTTWTSYEDGWITSKGTFQKGFDPTELAQLIGELPFIEIQIVKKKPVLIIAKKPENS